MDTETDQRQSQATNLFTFFREFARLNTKAVELLNSYVETLWFGQIPQESECSFAGLLEQKAIHRVLLTCDAAIKAYQKERAALKKQKMGLMEKLLTGAIRVCDLD